MSTPVSRAGAPPPAPPRILVFMEATSLTGPAKNFLELARRAGPRVAFSMATFLRPQSPGANAFVAACEQAGIPVYPIRERRALDPRVLPQMRRLAQSLTPDLVQSHSVKSHFLVRLSGLARQRGWIAFHHGYTSTNRKMAMYNRLDRFSLPAADRVVTVCAAFARELEKKGIQQDRLTVQHNSVRPFSPVDSASLARWRAEVPDLAPGARILLAVGRLSQEKGHVDLIRALGLLHRRPTGQPLQLVLVGDGPERDRLAAAARQAGIAHRVWFAGQQADVRPFYALADAVVIPSLSEGSPNVLLEAMAAGVPIVATAVGGIPELVSDGNEALLVPCASPQALADAIARLLDHEELRHQLCARAQAVAAAHSPERHCEAILALYRALLGVAGGRGLAPASAATIALGR